MVTSTLSHERRNVATNTYFVTLIRVSVPAVFLLPPHIDSCIPASIDRRSVLLR